MPDTCRFCNRVLRNPRHAAAGVGPVCARKRGLAYARKVRSRKVIVVAPLRPSPFTPVPLPFEEPQP